MQACLTFDNLTLGYGNHPAVHHLTGSVRPGSLTALVGPNGSGKSTLMKGIIGMVKPMSGACVRDGRPVAYLPQQTEIDRSFPASVEELVSLGLWPKRGLLGRFSREDRAKVGEALAGVGLAGFARRPIDTLSGGQLQRTLFARVLVQDADLILLDEPFNAIDANTIADLLGVIRRWHGEKRTVMVVAHDLDLVRAHFPETLLLARRPIAWGATEEVLAADNLARARRFDEAWSDDAPWCETPVGEPHVHTGHTHPHGGHASHAHDHAAHDHGHAHREALAGRDAA